MSDSAEHKYLRTHTGALVNTDEDDLQRYRRELGLILDTKEAKEKAQLAEEKLQQVEAKLDLILKRLNNGS